MPKGRHEVGFAAEGFAVEKAQDPDSLGDDRTDEKLVSVTGFFRTGVSKNVDIGVRGGFGTVGIGSWAMAQVDLKLALAQGRVGALALDPTVGLGATNAVPFLYPHDEEEEEESTMSWSLTPSADLPLLVALGSEEISFIASVGPSIRQNSFYDGDARDKDWTTDPWLVAMRVTTGLSFRVSSKVSMQPEIVYAAPLTAANHLRVMAGGIAVTFR
ncbi:MAG: hypothetical protein ACOC1F_07795 [Myxococcota bacterium]